MALRIDGLYMQISDEDFNRLSTYICDKCGIEVGDGKSFIITGKLSRLLEREGFADFHEFCTELVGDASGYLDDEIIEILTDSETLWFRDNRIWVMLEEVLLPNLIDALTTGTRDKLRIWSTACASGQEPYSLAILIDMLLANKYPDLSPALFEILATDISPRCLFMAVSGRYTQTEMSHGLDDSIRAYYFRETDEGAWAIDKKIRDRVTFKQFNFKQNFLSLGPFDLVLCRNVLKYYSDVCKRDFCERIGKTMTNASYLVLGIRERIDDFTDRFKQLEYEECMFYMLRD